MMLHMRKTYDVNVIYYRKLETEEEEEEEEEEEKSCIKHVHVIM